MEIRVWSEALWSKVLFNFKKNQDPHPYLISAMNLFWFLKDMSIHDLMVRLTCFLAGDLRHNR